MFALALVAAWGRFLWLEQHHPRERRRPREQHRRIPEAAPPRPAYPPIREDDPDDELAAYNAYLARLAEQDRR
jgi:hypothetical protein